MNQPTNLYPSLIGSGKLLYLSPVFIVRLVGATVPPFASKVIVYSVSSSAKTGYINIAVVTNTARINIIEIILLFFIFI